MTSLIDDLKRQNIQTVVLEEEVDEAEARRLRDRGVTSVLTHIDNDDPFLSGEVTPMTILRPRSVLVAVGSIEAIERLKNLVPVVDSTGHYVVAGYGEVGQRVVRMLRDAGEETFVIDRESDDGVDLVGDALDTAVLKRARIGDAKVMILALSGDGTNLFAATIMADLAPDLPIIARVNRASDITRIPAAGADFALSVGQVASQLLGRQLLAEEFVALETSMRLSKSSAASLAGVNPVSSGVRERTGCSIVAVERGTNILLNFDRDFEIERNDTLYICGAADNVERYFDLYPRSHTI